MSLEQRIRRDARRVAGDPEAATLLACLVQHLFDPNLDAAFLGKVCGASREVRDRLAAAVGPLKAYVPFPPRGVRPFGRAPLSRSTA